MMLSYLVIIELISRTTFFDEIRPTPISLEYIKVYKQNNRILTQKITFQDSSPGNTMSIVPVLLLFLANIVMANSQLTVHNQCLVILCHHAS